MHWTGRCVPSVTGTISKFVRRRRPPPLLAALAVTLATLSGLPAVAAEQVLVEFGSPITYLANASDPGIAMSWAAADYPDQTWNVGSYGIGYDTAGSAQNLLDTTVPPGTVSVYTRATFTIGDPLSLTSLWLGSDHDDGIVAWINGTEVFRSSEMPPSGPLQWNTPPAAPGEASNGATPDYTPYFDLSSAIPLLNPGDNVLAVGV